jgi:hypothetical protein
LFYALSKKRGDGALEQRDRVFVRHLSYSRETPALFQRSRDARIRARAAYFPWRSSLSLQDRASGLRASSGTFALPLPRLLSGSELFKRGRFCPRTRGPIPAIEGSAP